MQFCQARGCFNSFTTDGITDITFHVERHGIWSAVLGKTGKQTLLCNSHFEESCFMYRGSERVLKNGSIPTLNLSVTAIKPDVTIKKEGSFTTVQTHKSRTAEFAKLNLVNTAEPKDFRFIKNQLYCQAPGCFYRSTATAVSVHENRSGAWSALLGKTEKTCKLCNSHFEESCFTNYGGKRRLQRGSLPTLNLAVTAIESDVTIKKEDPFTTVQTLALHDDNSWTRASDKVNFPLQSNEPEDFRVIKKRRCQAPGCFNRSTTSGETVHINRRGIWSARLGKTDKICVLCNIHFSESCFIIRGGQRVLKKGSIPSLNMRVTSSEPEVTIKNEDPFETVQTLLDGPPNSWTQDSDIVNCVVDVDLRECVIKEEDKWVDTYGSPNI